MKFFFITNALLLLFICTWEIRAEDNLKVTLSQNKIEISPGNSSQIELKIEIPEGSYIYGNPKGPGIGKPTTVEIDSPGNIILEKPLFELPVKYHAKGDPNFVWIYRKETKIIIPPTNSTG